MSTNRRTFGRNSAEARGLHNAASYVDLAFRCRCVSPKFTSAPLKRTELRVLAMSYSMII